MRKPRPVFQFWIGLLETSPLIWRRFHISDLCTFWSLHVAIQSAMGWGDFHLHEFTVQQSAFGIPTDYDERVQPGWDHKVRNFVSLAQPKFIYEYDFGDSWRHEVLLEAICDKDMRFKYPRCLDGQGACPPEDVGGVPGYEAFLAVLGDSSHPEHDEYLTWVGGSFDPSAFDPAAVRFENPTKRLNQFFGNDT